MNLRTIGVIAARDLTVVARSRAVVLPIIVLPVIFFVLMPAGLVLLAQTTGEDLEELQDLLAMMPAGFLDELAGLAPTAQVLVWGLEYAFATLFLIVPLMVSSVIAADSFAGEKERKTLEALVYTPTTDAELYVGKLAGPWFAAMAVGVLGFLAYAVVANVLAAPIVGRPVVLTARWLLTIAWVMPAISALAVGALVIVSSRVRGFQEAYQLGGLVVLPLILLLVAQLSGALYLDAIVIAVIGAVVWGLAALALTAGYRAFRREKLLVQL